MCVSMKQNNLSDILLKLHDFELHELSVNTSLNSNHIAHFSHCYVGILVHSSIFELLQLSIIEEVFQNELHGSFVVKTFLYSFGLDFDNL